jgi:hypothetical protein
MRKGGTSWAAWSFLFFLPGLLSVRLPGCARDRIRREADVTATPVSSALPPGEKGGSP